MNMAPSGPRSICIVGADGAGKTTVGKAVTRELTYDEQRYDYWWCGWREFRTLPFRAVRRLLVTARGDAPRESTPDQPTPSLGNPTLRRQLLGVLYFQFVFLDHFLATVPKALLLSLRDRPVIYDRYYYGMLVGFCAYYSYPKWAVRLLLQLSVLYPAPDVTLYLDVEPETAFDRKDDVPTPDYVRNRRDLYRYVTDRTNAVTIDAEQPPDQVTADAITAVTEDADD